MKHNTHIYTETHTRREKIYKIKLNKMKNRNVTFFVHLQQKKKNIETLLPLPAALNIFIIIYIYSKKKNLDKNE